MATPPEWFQQLSASRAAYTRIPFCFGKAVVAAAGGLVLLSPVCGDCGRLRSNHAQIAL